MMGMLEAAQRPWMWMIPLQRSQFSTLGLCHGSSQNGHTELDCIQSHTWKWQRSRWISLQGPSGRGILMVQQCPGRHREPQEPWPGCLHLPRGLGQAREALAALCGVGGLTVLIELLQL